MAGDHTDVKTQVDHHQQADGHGSFFIKVSLRIRWEAAPYPASPAGSNGHTAVEKSQVGGETTYGGGGEGGK